MGATDVVIWHNPKCSKSRETLELLEKFNFDPKVRKYLDDPPTADELRAVVQGGVDLGDLVRSKEAKAAGIADLEGDALIQALAENPKAIERPVVIYGADAALGRPPHAVLSILPTIQGG